ncbi:Coagulation factor VIII [Exaiptasia diaphana]|nr:Coagulation factor VIII [Exaiptasia diaphana]
MQNRAIPDSSITASSYLGKAYKPQQGRLHIKSVISSSGKAGSWIPKGRRAGDWLQVDLGKVTRVQAVATQGRYDANQWVRSYTLQYSSNGKTFKKYQGGKVFKGNSDRHTVEKHNLNPPIYASVMTSTDTNAAATSYCASTSATTTACVLVEPISYECRETYGRNYRTATAQLPDLASTIVVNQWGTRIWLQYDYGHSTVPSVSHSYEIRSNASAAPSPRCRYCYLGCCYFYLSITKIQMFNLSFIHS